MTKLAKSVLYVLLSVVLFHQAAWAQTQDQGFEAMLMEKWDNAITIYSSMTKADNTDQNAWLTLSNAYLAKGQKDKAMEALSTGFTAKPDGPLAFVCNARTLLLQNKSAEADEQFQRAFKKGKKDPNALRQIAESYLFYIAPSDRKPNLTRANELFKQAIEVNPKDYQTLMSAGYAFREQGDGGEAARQFEFASNYKPKSPLPFYMLATVYKAGRLNERFIKNLDQAIALDNNYTPALRLKADYYYNVRKFEKAKDAYKELLEKGKDLVIEDEMAYANTLFLTKDYKGCTDLVEKIISKDGSKNYLRRLLGYSYYENGEYVKGQAIMDDYFKIVVPEKVLASDYVYQGRLLLKGKNDTLGAIKYLGLAINKDTAEWPLNEEMGNLLYAKKDYCGAARVYQVWIDSLKTEAKSKDYYKLGTCYQYCKSDSMRYQKALAAYIKVTEMSPKAGIGWLYAAKASNYLDIDPTKASEAEIMTTFGKAKPYWDKYIEVAGGDVEKNKANLIDAYSYIMYYHYVRKEDAQARENIAKLLVIDPANATALGMRDNMDGVVPPAPPAGGKNK
jgi:tetratricopeptide (TPR) repeat protein